MAEDAAAAAPSRPSAAAACATPPQEHHVTEPLVSSDGGSSPHRATARSRLSAASSPYPLVSSVGGSCAARSPRLQSYITGSELAAGATAYLLRFFAVAAPGAAPEVNDFAEWLAAKLSRAETFPGLHIVRRGREAGSSVAACVAAGILSLSWSFVHSQGLLWSEEITSGTHKWKQLSENGQAVNAACCTFHAHCCWRRDPLRNNVQVAERYEHAFECIVNAHFHRRYNLETNIHFDVQTTHSHESFG